MLVKLVFTTTATWHFLFFPPGFLRPRAREEHTQSRVTRGPHGRGPVNSARSRRMACICMRGCARALARPPGRAQPASRLAHRAHTACMRRGSARAAHACMEQQHLQPHFQWCSASLHLATFVAAVVVLIPCTPKPTTYSIHVCVRVARVGSVSHMQQQRLQRRIKHCLVAIDPRKSLLGWLGTTYTIEAFFKVVSSLVIVVTPTYIQLFF